MDTWLTILIACLGSGGFFTIVELLLNRFFSKKDGRDEMARAVIKLADRADTGDLNDSRIQLLILINHYPDNHYAILKEAENYFINLHGDSWVAEIVTKWAEEQNVDIEYIKRAHEATLRARHEKK